MPERILHILAVFAVIAFCLFGGERATLCLADGEWSLHAESSQSFRQPAACAVPLSFDGENGLNCGDGGCSDVEIRGVVMRPASPPDGVEALPLPICAAQFYFVAVPLPGAVTVSGGTWAVLHAPPRPEVADILGVRQI